MLVLSEFLYSSWKTRAQLLYDGGSLQNYYSLLFLYTLHCKTKKKKNNLPHLLSFTTKKRPFSLGTDSFCNYLSYIFVRLKNFVALKEYYYILLYIFRVIPVTNCRGYLFFTNIFYIPIIYYCYFYIFQIYPFKI